MIENYILIAVCYGFGCAVAYRLGFNKGGSCAIDGIVAALSEHFKTPQVVVTKALHNMIQKQMAQKAK